METLISELRCLKDIHYKTAKYNFTKRRILQIRTKRKNPENYYFEERLRFLAII